MQEFTRLRVNESQLRGVQGESRTATRVLDDGSAEGTPILDVAADGVPEFGEVDSDLVRAARFQSTFQLAAVTNRP